MKSLKIKTRLTERFEDPHAEVFREMQRRKTNRLRTLYQADDGCRFVKLHGEWWKINRCPAGWEWSRAYLVEEVAIDKF